MIYLFFLFSSCCYLSVLRKYSDIHNVTKLLGFSFPIILFWFLLIGGQYGVGTDYFSYMFHFMDNGGYFERKGDYLFATFVKFCNYIGMGGQGIFFALSLIWIIILLYVMQRIVGSKNIYIYFFVFVVYSGVFHNQMNIIRQYSAVYLLTLGGCFLYQKRYLFSIVLFVAMCFVHSSSIALIPFIFIVYLFLSRVKKRFWLYMYVVCSIYFSIFFSIDFVVVFIPYFNQYADYLKGDGIEAVDLMGRVTKYIYIPLVLYSIHLFPRMNLNEFQKQFFVTGICAYSLKLAVLSMSLIGRLGRYYEILACIPIVFLLIHLKNHSRGSRFILILLYLFLPYFMKVVFFAVREYTYNSVFFN